MGYEEAAAQSLLMRKVGHMSHQLQVPPGVIAVVLLVLQLRSYEQLRRAGIYQ